MASDVVFSVTEGEFEEKVVKASHRTLVLVDFWAEWCGPCKALAPALEREVEKRTGDVLLAKVNTDVEQKLAMFYRIEGLPTVLAFKGGKVVDEFVGHLPDAGIARFLDRLVPSEAEKKAQAGEAMEKADPKQAEAMFREALAKDAREEHALLGLARLLIDQDRDPEAASLLESLGPGCEQGIEVERLDALLWLRESARKLPDEEPLRARIAANDKDAKARYELGVRLALAKKYRDALEMLLSAGERDFKLAGGPVKEAMVKVFHLVGVRDPLADEYRAKLTSLLY